jgi:uncharacterized protein YebE (UPF0316 family)
MVLWWYMELMEVLQLAGAALLLFSVRIVGTALGTVRTLMMNRGMEMWSGVLGFGEIFVYVVGLGAVVNDLGNIAMLMGYCLGFSVGMVVGMRMEKRMALGHVSLRIISRDQPEDVVGELHAAGFGATLSWGEGRDGRVGIINTVVQRKHARRATDLVQKVDPGAFMVSDEARAVTRGWLPGATSPAPSLPVPMGSPSPTRPPAEPAEAERHQEPVRRAVAQE